MYAGVQKLLDDALADLNSGIGTSPGAADCAHFAGVTAKWVQSAHTLKARFYTDVRNYPAAYTEAQQGISASANSMLVPHGAVQNANENLMYAFIARNRAGDLNAIGTLAAQLLDPTAAEYKGNAKTDEKARQNFYFLMKSAAGATIPIIPNTGSTPQKGIFAQTASYPLVSYEENLLTLTETGVRSKSFSKGLAQLNAFRAYMNKGGYVDPTY